MSGPEIVWMEDPEEWIPEIHDPEEIESDGDPREGIPVAISAETIWDLPF